MLGNVFSPLCHHNSKFHYFEKQIITMLILKQYLKLSKFSDSDQEM